MWKAELYYNGGFLRESDGYEFDSEEEAMEEVENWKVEFVENWKANNSWDESDSEELFETDYDFDYDPEDLFS